MGTFRCCQTIEDIATHGTKQCSRKAVWFVTTLTNRGVCSQHRRWNDDRRIVRP